jgi:dethiobiotin synthetase
MFITGTDTNVGKTCVAAAIAQSLAERGLRVGVYKPAASGSERNDDVVLVSDDALRLWNAAGRPGELERVCPQCFAAPLAPHLAARAEGKELDPALLRHGLDYWLARSDAVLVEGAGGLMSPLGDEEYIADLAADLDLPLVIVAPNELGVINQTLQTLIVAQTRRLAVAGIVLNRRRATCEAEDPSLASNRRELERRSAVPVLAELLFDRETLDDDIDWLGVLEFDR